MTINYTPLLSLAEPVTGTQSGTWGDDVNQGLTDYLDIAVAGTQTISGSQTAVTLTKTTGSASGSNIAQVGSAGATGTAQYAVILCNGNPASMLTITAPASSKTYVVINATSTNQAVKIAGTGPTTGVTVPNGKVFMVAWNGSDFVAIGGGVVNLATDVTGTLPIANGGTGQTTQQAAINALVGTQTANRVLRSDGTNSTLSQVALATDVSGTLPVANGGTGQTTYTDGQLLIGNSTGNTLTKATLTASTGVSVTNGSGAITITNTAPDQVVSLTGAGATTISGTYPNFTISSVNTTYGTATTTVNGLIKLGDGTVQTTAANAVSADASRTYAIQLNASGQAVVNVPWASGSGTITGVTATSPVASSGGTAPVISLSANYGDTLNPYASKTANFVLAAPNGSSGAPTFRALVAADIPTLNQNTSGTAGGIAGGTAGQILYQTGVGTTGFISVGGTGQLLISSGGGFYGWASKTSLNTASTIVERDASGNFSAGTITATLSGNASTSTTATNATYAYIALDTSSATAQYLTFASGLIGNYGLRGASTDLTYTPSTKTLNVAGTVTTTTQTSTDNSTKVATTAFVQTAIGSTGATGTRGQAFTSNGTFTIPTGVTALKITVVGGGGGGGVGINSGSSSTSGYGGGGGGTAQSFLTGLTPGNTLSVTIGSGGVISGSGGNSTVTSGTQTISTITGGGGSVPNGGTSSGGTINSVGGAGGPAETSTGDYVPGGAGGSSRYGGGGPGGVVGAGTAGGAYGGGGGGGFSNNGNGSSGAAGVVIFEW